MYMEPGMHITCLQWCCSVRFGSTESGTIADAAAPNLTLKHRCRHFHLHTRPHNHLIHTFNMHQMFVWPGMQVVCKCVIEHVRFSSAESGPIADSAPPNLTLRHHCRHFYLNTRPHKHLIHTFNVHWMFVWPGMHVCDWAMLDSAVPNLVL